jgi:hypothetical protein
MNLKEATRLMKCHLSLLEFLVFQTENFGKKT